MEITLKQDGKYQYIDEGEGPILLLLHGLFGALSNWTTVISHFKANYRLVVPLLPIYKLPLPRTNVDGLSDFVHDFVTHMGFDKVNVMGNSLGGHVALVYSLDHPEHLNSLTLTGSSGLYENAFGGSFPKRKNYEFIKSKTEFTFYDPNTATKELVDEVFEIVNDRMKGLRIVMMAKSAIRHNLREEIKTIEAPTCLIWGKEDKITPPEVAEEFHALIPNSELHWVEKCGHAPMMEQPAEFNVLMEGFLNRVNVPSLKS